MHYCKILPLLLWCIKADDVTRIWSAQVWEVLTKSLLFYKGLPLLLRGMWPLIWVQTVQNRDIQLSKQSTKICQRRDIPRKSIHLAAACKKRLAVRRSHLCSSSTGSRAGPVTNSILFCWLFKIKDRRKKVRFQQTHNQGLRQLLLTLSWDLR